MDIFFAPAAASPAGVCAQATALNMLSNVAVAIPKPIRAPYNFIIVIPAVLVALRP